MHSTASPDLPLQSFQSGGYHAFETIFLHYRDRLCYFALKIVKNRDVAEDIVQEAFVRLWLRRQKVQLDTLESYLFTITRNLAVDHLKTTAQQHKFYQEHQHRVGASQNAGEQHLFDTEYQHHLHVAISQLPPQRKKVFRLTRDQGLSHEAVAQRLGISKETVKRQVSFALKDIRAYLKQHTDIAISLLLSVFLKFF